MSTFTEDGHQVMDPRVDLALSTKAGVPLSPFMVLNFYSQGIFPWLYNQHKQQLWWSFDPRSVLFVKNLRINRSLRKTLQRKKYRVTADTDFEAVVRQCRETRDSSWITDEMVDLFCTLHRFGHTHSLEVWEGDKLVGGLFGCSVGQMFSGASMFSTSPDASKVALVALCRFLSEWGVPLLDCQLQNPHLVKMGATLLDRESYLQVVKILTSRDPRGGSWTKYFK